ncbi:hypothetical protein EVAR_34610_1 [Eumeta japonica]|uniref:Uncharacterized protein n=1 Tax=Eumeta variegata TaxID=151549 RepID=A0A4C1VIN7_EUMVA|nr:hypothetical protein EVAR_34610_1 [Eumeta japonica]
MQHATHRRPSNLFFHYESQSNQLNIDSKGLTAIPYIEERTKQSVSEVLVASASADFNNPDSHWISVVGFKCP